MAITKPKEKQKKLRSPERRDVLIPEIEVFFNTVITSCHDIYADRVIMDKAESSRDQVVVAVGSSSKVKVGDWVHINFGMFPMDTQAPKHDIGPNKVAKIIPVYKIGNTEYMYLNDNHIMWKLKK